MNIIIKIFIATYIIFVLVFLFVLLITHKGWKRGEKQGYPRDDRVKWNPKAKKIRIIKATYTGGGCLTPHNEEISWYEIWERKLFIFSVRYDASDYRTLEEAKHQVQKIIEYVETETKEEEIVSFK